MQYKLWHVKISIVKFTAVILKFYGVPALPGGFVKIQTLIAMTLRFNTVEIKSLQI